jgi:hypothetical protein
MDDIEIKCPHCKARITISRQSGQILHHEEFKKGPAAFDSFLEKQKSRSEDLKRKFEESQRKGAERMKSIEEKIAWAKKHADENPPVRPPDMD